MKHLASLIYSHFIWATSKKSEFVFDSRVKKRISKQQNNNEIRAEIKKLADNLSK